jgi:hypothetical protein
MPSSNNPTPSSSAVGLPSRSSLSQPSASAAQPQRALNDQAILEYLARRGFAKAEGALRAELANAIPNSSAGKGRTVGLEEFADKNANTSDAAVAGLGKKKEGVGRNLLKQPSEYAKGYEGLREFVNNVSLFRLSSTKALFLTFLNWNPHSHWTSIDPHSPRSCFLYSFIHISIWSWTVEEMLPTIFCIGKMINLNA